jgi:hypothetical protein
VVVLKGGVVGMLVAIVKLDATISLTSETLTLMLSFIHTTAAAHVSRKKVALTDLHPSERAGFW